VYQRSGQNVIHVFSEKDDLKGKMAIFGGFSQIFPEKNQTFFCGMWATDTREV